MRKLRGVCWIVVVAVFCVSLSPATAFAQEEENPTGLLPPAKPFHSPTRATVYSALLPGLGQAYNQKYWKIPVIYAGFATLGYFIQTNHKEYIRFKTAYQLFIDDDPLTIDEFNGTRSADELLFYKDEFRRNRDLSIILTVGLYALNIIDASVDAHFFDYSISPDLSLHLQPSISPTEFPGLRIALRF
jgi:hypothetical protein